MQWSLHGLIVGVMVLWLAVTQLCHAQCQPEWLPGDGIPGVNGAVNAMTTWDPDGSGPLGEWLIVGGEFTFAGDTSASNIAAWDGGSWHSLDVGVNGIVRALLVHQGELLVGGEFTSAGGVSTSRVAKWDGTRWHALGSGVAGPGVYAIAEYDGSLIVGGDFRLAGGAEASNIAMWDGLGWRSLGSGTDGVVRALSVYHGELVAGGNFWTAGGTTARGIAKWDGHQWEGLQNGVGGIVYAMTSYQGDLVVSGQFVSASGVVAVHIARWNGNQWRTIGESVNGLAATVLLALLGVGDDLIVGGNFQTDVGGIAFHVARWDGNRWRTMGNGFNERVRSLAFYDGDVVAGGLFDSAGLFGDRIYGGLGFWNGETWESKAPGFDHAVSALHEHNGDLIAGGWFTMAGGVAAARIARWDGVEWHALAHEVSGGVPGVALTPFVRALETYNGDLIAGGRFVTIDGIPAASVARWDGERWQALADGLTQGVYSTQVSVMHEYNGHLYVAGSFTMAGGQPAAGFARWDGHAWHAVDSGATGSIAAITQVESDLVIGAQSPRSIMRWNGVEWRPIVPDPNPLYTLSLLTHGKDLIAGGRFYYGAVPITFGATRWDGAHWTIIGGTTIATGLPPDVRGMIVYRDEIVATGSFVGPTGEDASRMARWDGERWRRMEGGLRGSRPGGSPYGQTLTLFGDDLVVGGSFYTAGDQVSAFVARWGCACYADCDQASGAGVLDIFDYLCFGNQFDAGQAYACDCDLSTGPGVCDVFDFLCFSSRFAQGCQ